MTTTRPYRKALSVTEALKRLGDAAGTQLQEELVAEFINAIETDARRAASRRGADPDVEAGAVGGMIGRRVAAASLRLPWRSAQLPCRSRRAAVVIVYTVTVAPADRGRRTR